MTSLLKLILLFIILSRVGFAQDDLQQIRPFGTNPGNLKLMLYEPANITEKAPLVFGYKKRRIVIPLKLILITLVDL